MIDYCILNKYTYAMGLCLLLQTKNTCFFFFRFEVYNNSDTIQFYLLLINRILLFACAKSRHRTSEPANCANFYKSKSHQYSNGILSLGNELTLIDKPNALTEVKIHTCLLRCLYILIVSKGK